MRNQIILNKNLIIQMRKIKLFKIKKILFVLIILQYGYLCYKNTIGKFILYQDMPF